MKIIAQSIHKFDIWFTKNFWSFFTNVNKKDPTKEFYQDLAKQHKKESTKLLESSDNFIC